MSTRPPLLDEATAAFLQGGLSVIAASSDETNGPAIVRVLGCRVATSRRQVTVLIPASDPFLDAIRATGRIAVVFAEPRTHRSIQLKGIDARTTRLLPSDAKLNQRYRAAFVTEVGPLGYSEAFLRALVSCEPPKLTPVTFTLSAAFLQTPGPRAGHPLVDGVS